MKKALCLIAFAIFTLLGTVDANAQKDINTEAKMFTQKLSKEFSLTGEQQRSVYNAYLTKARKLRAIPSDSKDNSKTQTEVNLKFDEKMKATLTEEQYNSYSKKFKKNK